MSTMFFPTGSACGSFGFHPGYRADIVLQIAGSTKYTSEIGFTGKDGD
jgi:hypothetical protein